MAKRELADWLDFSSNSGALFPYMDFLRARLTIFLQYLYANDTPPFIFCVVVVRHAQCRGIRTDGIQSFRRISKEMFGFHKSKIYRSNDGCCICKTKSSSSRFTDSSRYEENFRLCFGLSEDRVGDICNACVLLVKRWKKLPLGSKKNWSHVVDARAGPGFKLTKPKKVKNIDGKKKSKLKKLHKFKRQNSDAHSTTSSMSPSQSPSHSNQSDDGSDIETKQRRPTPAGFSFLDLSYWKRQKVCCGIIYKGRFGEVIIDPRLFKPCCSAKEREALASTSDMPSPTTLPSPLPEDLKETR